MRKEDLKVAAELTAKMFVNMGINKGIRMETLAKSCDALQRDITDNIELVDRFPCSQGKRVIWRLVFYA